MEIRERANDLRQVLELPLIRATQTPAEGVEALKEEASPKQAKEQEASKPPAAPKKAAAAMIAAPPLHHDVGVIGNLVKLFGDDRISEAVFAAAVAKLAA